MKTSNVHIRTNKKKMMFMLYMSKTHTKASKPQVIKIASINPHTKTFNGLQQTALNSFNRQQGNNSIMSQCPFVILVNYLELRKKEKYEDEQFFVFSDRNPVKLSHLCTVLKNCLKHLRINHTLYSMHSFRAGRSLDLMKMGLSVETIKKLGRWRSNAVYTYLS